ncbi:hypothetical protein CEE37_02320 [candidate division LCP-89 bacterium B3_LCP]|uniref:FlgD/Vpr Ig-like domain-containing protein n=1 Tax=candidate division LCP-89 bacterium B3_LCP TaxID=2012998 RepID=A0A532V5Q6_UNCL8|nr:MAG: hypothetical protein CEE37_02320 [candidate division LCP-89 bacterium B3_LCP]
MKNHSNLKTTLIISILLIIGIPHLASSQQGATGIDPNVGSGPIIDDPATIRTAEITPEVPFQPTPAAITDDWVLISSDSISFFIPEGEHFAIMYDPQTEELSFQDPNPDLSATQMAAIERAPRWLRADLYDNFRRFDYPIIADWVADEILNAPDPYVDEVAFQAAHIAPGVLGGNTYLQLLLENSQWVYEIDSSLNYVELVDYGVSNDDDYWTTAVYTTIEEGGDTIQVEVDREIYYWYVLHPKLSDEMPTYINPETGYPADPPVGVFWRDYLWHHADPGYPLFSEQFGDCDFLWARSTGPNDAIATANQWVSDVMNWNVGPERPIQPVRIYALHQGYCGEHSDIRGAAGRVALIPSVCTTNFCEDHVWNEFWEREWIHWDGGSVNTPLMYENSWGKTLSAVFNWRGDGSVWTVTERYSEDVCTLNVMVYDSLGKPADSERITIQSNALWGGMYYATWGVTNSEGIVTFLLGDDQNYYLRIDGPLGAYPFSGGYAWVVGSTQPGAVYDFEHTFDAYTPDLEVSQAPDYPNPDEDYLVEIIYECEYETEYATYFTYNDFGDKQFPGLTDVFVLNDSNFTAHEAFDPALGFEISHDVSSGTISFVLPTDSPWYTVFSSRELSLTRPWISGVVNVYRNTLNDVSVTLTPYNPPVTVPASGGDFDFNIALTNNEAVPVTYDAWIMVQLPDGTWIGPVLGPVNLTQAGGATLEPDRTQVVPATAPAGTYTYEARVGAYPDEVWSTDSFTFEKLTTGDGIYAANWENSGEGFDQWFTTMPTSSPSELSLMSAFPNPFNNETVISFSLPSSESVRITIYNLLGQEVATLTDQLYAGGTHNVRWDGRNYLNQVVTSGVYLVKMSAGNTNTVQKICFVQ